MRQQITSLEDLNAFVSDEANTKELKLKVFLESMKAFPLKVMVITIANGNHLVDDPHNILVPNMQRVLAEIIAEPNKDYFSGFMVILK